MQRKGSKMKIDILIAGVGGQGILSLAYVLNNAAMAAGYYFKQTEVHGMSQRGGAVVSHVRISDEPVYSNMIPLGKADIIVGVEPLESLRYISFLKPEGQIITNSEPFVNIPNYPEMEEVKKAIAQYKNVIFDATGLAKKAGSPYAQNIVLLGALSHFLPFDTEMIKKLVADLFAAKGEKMVNLNTQAYEYGREAINA